MRTPAPPLKAQIVPPEPPVAPPPPPPPPTVPPIVDPVTPGDNRPVQDPPAQPIPANGAAAGRRAVARL